MVAHGGVADRLALAQPIDASQSQVYLTWICQIPGEDALKGCPHLLPMAQDGQYVLRQIRNVGMGECGVGGQHRRGQHGTAYPHGADHRKRHRQGAFAQTG